MYVKSVVLENLRGFKKLRFDFGRGTSEHPVYAGWTVFVGGNGSGKSTLLKGIALALMGHNSGRRLMETTKGWIRDGEKNARVETDIVWNEDHDRFTTGGGKRPGKHIPIALRWDLETKEDVSPRFRAVEMRSPNGARIQSAERGLWIANAERGLWNENANGWFCAGYGPMRRLSGSSSESIGFGVQNDVVSRFVTLFREDAALSESEAWLKTNYSRSLEMKDDPRFGRLVSGVSDLLSDELLPHGMKIDKISVDHVWVTDRSKMRLPMRDISDGCRSMYATVLDLVHGMFDAYGIDRLFAKDPQGRTIVNRPGVVLIDEIEAHLHPSWQRDIPEWLKVHFPLVQFLVSTHSPLVAQAADPNGIFVLPSPTDIDREPRALDELEANKIRLGCAEKTLLGAAFGLKTARSAWAVQQIERWKKLNAKKLAKASLSSREKKDHAELRKQMELAFEPGLEPGLS
jgi:energy-coupling factor transporter ATP-binding protein EcfA2